MKPDKQQLMWAAMIKKIESNKIQNKAIPPHA